MIFIGERSKLQEMNLLFVLCILLGTLQVGTSLFDTFDTSYYKILVDQNGGNFSYWDSKCRGELNFPLSMAIVAVAKVWT